MVVRKGRATTSSHHSKKKHFRSAWTS